MNAGFTKPQLISLENLKIEDLTKTLGNLRLALFTFSEIFLKEGRELPLLSEALAWTATREAFRHARTAVTCDGILFLYIPKHESAKAAFVPLREAFTVFSENDLRVVLRGVQLGQWSEKTLFCSGCGAALVNSATETAKVCEKCSRTFYPQYSPAVIVLVYRDVAGDDKSKRREILLAKGLAPRKFFSCIAGFSEAGETLEDTVHREVFEETGVKVKNLRYFGSQPWPFPSQMMIGFHAEWASGELRFQASEITDGGWFTAETLPPLPIRQSIAWQLIQTGLTPREEYLF